MASPNSVPSRTVLNALRGVVFGTSCSVVLLAEERRRRIKAARTAIDNARHLHTVKSRRRSIGLGLSDLDDAAGSLSPAHPLPAPRTTGVRRRRRATGVYLGELAQEDGIDNLADSLAERSSPEGSDAVARPADAQESATPEKHQSIPTSHRSVPVPTSASDATPRSGIPVGEMHGRWAPPKASINDNAPPGEYPSQASRPIEWPTTIVMSEKPFSFAESLERLGALQAARRLLEAQHVEGSPICDEYLASLDALLADLASLRLGSTKASVRLDVAIETIDRLAADGALTEDAVNRLKVIGMQLLKAAVVANPVKATAIFQFLALLCKDIARLLTVFIAWLQKRNHHNTIALTLRWITDPIQPRHLCSRLSVSSVLNHRRRAEGGFEATKRLYSAFQDAGLFQTVRFPQDVELEIRRTMALQALDVADDSFAEAELEHIIDIRPEEVKSHLPLRRALVVRDARLGLWTDVGRNVDAFKAIPDDPKDLQRARLHAERLADALAQSQAPAELFDSLLRQLVEINGLVLETRWVYPVLDSYCSRQKLQSTLSWLDFCKSSGVRTSGDSAQKFWSGALKHWGYTGAMAASLQRHIKGEARPAAGVVAGKPRSENEMFTRLTVLSKEMQWGGVCELYEKESRGRKFSSRCFRLYIAAHIKQDGGDTARAVELTRNALEKGHDAASGVMSLMMAQLENGEEPVKVVRGGLQKGIRIHDSVYNVAAQKLTASGDMDKAVALCEIAAQKNGKGELAYNQYNFANLVFSYVGLKRYDELRELLATFTEREWEWWQGRVVCTGTLKLAIKETAKRAKLDRAGSRQHNEANDGLREALRYALSHDVRHIRQPLLDKVKQLITANDKAGQATVGQSTRASTRAAVGERESSTAS